MKRLVQLTTTLLLSALVLATGSAFSADLSLRETIHLVSEVTNVFPIDVYMGTSISDYRNWDCRYDLTYSQFRANYLLYMTAQNTRGAELVECFDAFPEMTPKEKVLTCVALSVYARTRRELESRIVVVRSDSEREKLVGKIAPTFRLLENVMLGRLPLTEEEKESILQRLQDELDNRDVAFPKIEDSPQLAGEWEQNLREEFGRFMRLRRCYDRITERHACCDLYDYPRPEKIVLLDVDAFLRSHGASEEIIRRNRYPGFGSWNNDSETLPLDFLCGAVLAQASFDVAQLRNPKFFESFPEERSLSKRLYLHENDVITERFLRGRKTIPESIDFVFDPMYEGVVMNAFLRTQGIASRYGFQGENEPIRGNSSDKDVLVSDVVQKAIDVLTDMDRSHESASNDLSSWKQPPASNERASEFTSSVSESQRAESTLDSIRKNAKAAEIFSLNWFLIFYLDDLGLYPYEGRPRTNGWGRDYPSSEIRFPNAYERFKVYNTLYEAAKRASRAEIVECLNAYDDLSPKEKAFVLASTSLYILRTENPETVEATPESEKAEPLSDDDKSLFADIVQNRSKEDDRVAFQALETYGEDWEKEFRESAFLLQRYLGASNPFYSFFPHSEAARNRREKAWQTVCDEAPIALLYSILAMETRLDLNEIDSVARDFDVLLGNDEKPPVDAENAEPEETAIQKINEMRRFLLINIGLSNRTHSDPAPGYTLPDASPGIDRLRLSQIAEQIEKRFLNKEFCPLPTVSNAID